MLGNSWGNSERVFVSDSGYDMNPNAPYKILQKIIKKYNLRPISFHALRHTSISLQIATDLQAQIISKRAGHSNISLTHAIYSHFFNKSFEQVANKMDKFFQS